MRTTKPISTISYNTPQFLYEKCEELVRNHTISDWMFITHHAESDEKKDHNHLFLKPNKLLDTMDLQSFFMELDPNKPDKPLKCIDFVLSKTDDWILYNLHLTAYLASKGESREYHYTKDDFVFHDEDTFDDLYLHALKGSDWAKKNQILSLLRENKTDPSDLILSGAIPFNMATNLNALNHMIENKVYRNGRPDHEEPDHD